MKLLPTLVAAESAEYSAVQTQEIGHTNCLVFEDLDVICDFLPIFEGGKM